MTSIEQKAQQFFGQRAAFYTTSTIHTEKVVLDRVVELAQPQATDLALDIGTGTGHTAFALAPHVAQVIGVDLTLEMLVEARKLQADRGISNVEFHLGDVSELLFDDATFDIVACRRAAHHFSNITRAIDEMKRVLKPRGRLVIDDRSVPEDDFVDATMNRLDWLHDESHVREYRPSEWVAVLEAAGFAIDAVEPYTRHRPLTSLTHNVSAHNVEQIHSIISMLNNQQRVAMNVAEIDGEIYTNHWFVMLAAVKAGTGD